MEQLNERMASQMNEKMVFQLEETRDALESHIERLDERERRLDEFISGLNAVFILKCYIL